MYRLNVLNDFLTLRYFRGHALADIYLASAIKTLGLGMVAVFEPIYLFQFFAGLGIAFPASVVLAYYALFFLCFGLLTPFGGQLASRFGFAKIALVSTPFLFFYYVFLLLLPKAPFLIVAAFCALVIRAFLFWPGFHLVFAMASSPDHRGSAYGNLAVIVSSFQVVGPVLGGFIIGAFGFPVLFALILPLVLVSALPFFLVRERHIEYRGGIRDMLRHVKDRASIRPALAFAATASEFGANAYIWPLFLFSLAISFESLGIVVAMAVGVSMLATFLIGRLSDRVNKLRLLRLGSALTIAAWLVRAGVQNAFTAGMANIIYGLSRATAHVPFMAMFYDDAASAKNMFHAIIFREITVNVGRAFFLAGAAALALLLPDLRLVLVVTAALVSFFPLIRYWRP